MSGNGPLLLRPVASMLSQASAVEQDVTGLATAIAARLMEGLRSSGSQRRSAGSFTPPPATPRTRPAAMPRAQSFAQHGFTQPSFAQPSFAPRPQFAPAPTGGFQPGQFQQGEFQGNSARANAAQSGLAQAQAKTMGWMQRFNVAPARVDHAIGLLMDTPLTQAHFAPTQDSDSRLASYMQVSEILKAIGVRPTQQAVTSFIGLLPQRRETAAPPLPPRRRASAPAVPTMGSAAPPAPATTGLTRSASLPSILRPSALRPSGAAPATPRRVSFAIPASPAGAAAPARPAATSTAPVQSVLYKQMVQAQNWAERRLTARGAAITPESLMAEIDSVRRPQARPLQTRPTSAPVAATDDDADLRAAKLASLSETGPADPLSNLSPVEKRAKAPALVRTMGMWNSKIGDIMPHLAARALDRTVVVRHGDHMETVPGGTPEQHPLVIDYDPAGRHYSVEGVIVPDNGDCLVHSLLLAMKDPDWQSPNAVSRLRDAMATQLENNWAEFSHTL